MKHLGISLLFLCIVCSAYGMDHYVTVSDTIKPTITVEASDLTVSCNNLGNANINQFQNWYNDFGGAEATDNGTVTLVPDITLLQALDSLEAHIGYTCGGESFVTVTWTAIDDCDNQSETSTSATFATNDATAPVFIVSPMSVSMECNEMTQDSLNSWVENKAGSVVSDACSDPDSLEFFRYIATDNFGNTITGDYNEPVNIPLNNNLCYTFINVSFWVRDECGNQKIESAQFMIDDNEPPVWSVPITNEVISCDDVAPPLATIFGVDACAGDIIATTSDQSTQSSNPGSCDFYNYEIIRTWSVSDPCGNSIETIQLLVVEDNEGPQFNIIDTLILDCTQVDSTEFNFAPTELTDNCSPISLDFEDSLILGTCDYEILREWTAVDICGNVTTKVQHLLVSDTSDPEIMVAPQDVNVDCSDFGNVISELNDWLNTRGYSQVTESCTSLNSFVALPGSYDIADPTSYPGDPVNSLFPEGCPSSNNFTSSVTADFVFYDDCGNAILSSATFGVIDTIVPEIILCPDDIEILITDNNCSALHTLEYLEVTDNCGDIDSPIQQSVSQSISSTIPGSDNIPVDSLIVSFGAFNLLSTPANGNVTLQFSFSNVDMDDATEFFYLKDEDGIIIDSTNNTPNQCGDVTMTINTITPAQINTWALDGIINFSLVPNIPNASGVFAINDVCNGSSVTSEILFDIDVNTAIIPAYSIDQGDTVYVTPLSFPIDTILDTGIHEVEYLFFDCTGNMTSCVQQVAIIDNQGPVLTCPGDITIDLLPDSCSLEVQLSDQVTIVENCALPQKSMLTVPENPNDAFIEFGYSMALDTFLASNVFFSFEEVDSIVYSTAPVLLNIEVTGDIDEIGERYEIFGENGIALGFTALDPSASCGSSDTQFKIDVDTYNDWASDGQIQITAVAPNNDQISGGGINNCGPVDNGSSNDNISSITAIISLTDACVFYEVSGATTIASTELVTNDTIAMVLLNGGVNTITYIATDAAGNTGTCAYDILLNDTEPPTVSCTDLVIFIHPDGLQEYILDPAEIVMDAADNCAIDSFELSIDTFDCTQIGTVADVTVTAYDLQGNTATCMSQVRIETAILEPSFTVGICQGDTLQLFANVPDASVANAYTFSWTDPMGNFFSNQENPIVPNPTADDNGTYILEVTGFNGCTSTGTLEVFVQQLTTPVITTSDIEACTGESIVLNATVYTGAVDYLWYEGIAPNGVLLETTSSASLVISPSSGEHFYYVEVESTDCSTSPSTFITINIVEAPIATVVNPFVTICEGDVLSLGTDVFDPSYTYTWTGPDDYDETGQFPPSISDVSIVNQGQYNLVIDNGVCLSNTAVSQVVVFDQPETPVITGEEIYCEGTSLALSVNNITDADQYVWYLDGNFYITEMTNNLFISPVQSNLSGEWTVVVKEGICFSDTSEVQNVFIEEEFQIGATNSGPVCQGDSISLSVAFIPGAEYLWQAPNGDLIPGQNPTVLAIEGNYTVSVMTNSGCEIEETTFVSIDELPVITALSNSSQDCMDGTEPIQFFPTIVPTGNYDYEWTGPGNFDPDEASPIIDNASSIHNGVYTLIVRNGQCVSDPVVTTVSITDTPMQPIIEGQSVYCDNQDVILNVGEVSGAIYSWNTPVGNIETAGPQLVLDESAGNLNGNYTVSITINGCESVLSEVFTIIVSEVPTPPNITSNSPICLGDSIKFTADFIANASYAWAGPNFNSNEQNPIIPASQLSDQGMYTLTVTANGCVLEEASLEIVLLESPVQPALDQNQYSICEEGAGIEVCVTTGTMVEGALYTFYINNSLIIDSSDPCIVIDPMQLNSGEANEVFIITSLEGCSSIPSEVSMISVDGLGNILAEATQNNYILCDESQLALTSVFGMPDVEPSWMSLTDDVIITDADQQIAMIENIQSGQTIIVLSYSSGSCLDYTTDTIRITNYIDIDALNDSINVSIDMAEAINLLDNDLYDGSINVEIIEDPEQGSYDLVNGFLTYNPDPNSAGEQRIVYEICYDDCPEICDVAELIINIEQTEECILPTIFTPNQDGINDFYIIPCFSGGDFLNNDVRIFNQWGDEVYYASPYDNSWNGIYKGSNLPVGTYFVIVDKGDGSEPINGFIHLER